MSSRALEAGCSALLLTGALVLCGCPKPAAAVPDAGPAVVRTPVVTLLITGAENGYLLPNPDDQGVSRGGAAQLLGRWVANHGHCAGPLKADGSGACANASTLVLSTGDNGNGASISSYFRAVPAAEVMAQMGYAASAFGNRELDFGRAQFVLNAKTGGFPYLAADLRAYLQDSIRYELGDEEQRGLQRFFDDASKAGLLPRATVRFFDEDRRTAAKEPSLDTLLARASEGERLSAAEGERLPRARRSPTTPPHESTPPPRLRLVHRRRPRGKSHVHDARGGGAGFQSAGRV